MKEHKSLLDGCLYFTTNSLSRAITRMAEEEFRLTGLSPSHAFLLMTVSKNNGINPNELAKKLQIAPSTVTRFVDSLENRGYLTREVDGKISKIYSTEKGQDLQKSIHKAWKSLYHRYSEILGERFGDVLNDLIVEASKKLH